MEIDISIIISLVLLGLSLVLGGKWLSAKKFLKEVAEALTVTSKAIEDDKITRKELKDLMKEWNDVIEAAKSINLKSLKEL